MKFIVTLAITCLVVIAFDSYEHIVQRHDSSPEYIVYGKNHLEVELSEGNYQDYSGPYKAQAKLSYRVLRSVARTVTVKSSRRIIQRIAGANGPGKKHVYTFLSPNPNVLLVDTFGRKEEVHVTVELPGYKDLPPGKNYVIESGVEIPSHGEKQAQTITSESEPFDVE